jgi:putative membrane protein
MKRIQVKGRLLVCFLMTVGFSIFSTSVLADYRNYYGCGPGMMGWWGPMSWFGPLGMILFWVLLIIAIVLLVRGIRTSRASGNVGGPAAESAMDILKKRYARGEINKEEFLEKKKALE